MKKSLGILFAVALLNAGCSTVNLVYRNADWYLTHKINSYASFDTRQKATFRQEVSNYMLWHRKNVLPNYISFLQNLDRLTQYDGELKSEEIARLRADLLSLYRKTMAPMINPASKFLIGLNSTQLEEMRKNLANENHERLVELLGENNSETLNLRAEKTIDFVEWLAGSLTRKQQQLIDEMSRELPIVSHIYIEHRDANQGRLIALLNDHADADTIAVFLSSWLHTPEASRTTQQQDLIQSFEMASNDMIARIHRLFTANQKKHMHKKILSYIEDFQNLTQGANAVSSTPP